MRAGLLKVGKQEVRITHPDKLYFPQAGFKKADAIGYYLEIAPIIIPHLKNRPLTLKRYPEGAAAGHFYEKDAPGHAPQWVKTFSVQRRIAKAGDESIEYVLVNDAATLIWTVNLANVEMHPFLAKTPHLERPTSVVFDLDPGAPADILACCKVALELRRVFQSLELQSFVKVSGSKGLQVYVPLNGSTTYDVTRPFAQSVARFLAQQHPELVIWQMPKAARRGKVFIDWSQNEDYKTTVAPYSLRAKSPRPYVSLPVEWDEIARAEKKNNASELHFEPGRALERVKSRGDIFEPVLKLKQKLPAEAVGRERRAAPKRRKRPRAEKGNSLSVYAEKRDFSATTEPPPAAGKGGSEALAFVVQKHQATHLHYDFRLEMDGVLRSWAVPKGPSTVKGERRLAMHVEDHPLEYRDFEGVIPPGNYGAGTVMVWDTGRYTVKSGDPAGGYRAGKLHLFLSGKKLQGEWALVKTNDDKRWYLIKAAQDAPPVSKEQDDRSAVSGRTMKQIAGAGSLRWERGGGIDETREKPIPTDVLRRLPRRAAGFVEPMNPQAVTELARHDGDWLYEAKLDGFRALLVKNGGKVQLMSRKEKGLGARFEALLAQGRLLPCESAVLDGEVLVLDEHGRPSFQLLQNYSPAAPSPLVYFVFDLLNVDGRSFLDVPIEERRQWLRRLIEGTGIQFSEALDAPPEVLVRSLRDLGMEGVVAKKKGSRYQPGKRGGAWVKFKLNAEQEFVIGGYTKGRPFDALLVGYYENGRLIFAGKVRAGLTKIREELAGRFATSEQCPFSNLPEPKTGEWGEGLNKEEMAKCVWLEPQLVARIAFTEWTRAGHLRHAAFVALREDKAPEEVVREVAA